MKPKNIDEYKKWIKEFHGFEISDRTRTYYESASNKMLQDFRGSSLWTTLLNHLSEWDQTYYLETGYYLFVGEPNPELNAKPFKSFLLKTFRKNVINNENWPEAPTEGWLLPDNWFTCVNDIVRTVFTVKYLDGVNFFIERLRSLCGTNQACCEVDFEAKEEGYYAAHAYTEHSCQVPKEDWDTKEIAVSIEIQVTTQLQEVIRSLLHKYYEESRKKLESPELKWQWDYKSEDFSANYLGHILHYVEGMIMEVRSRQKGETNER